MQMAAYASQWNSNNGQNVWAYLFDNDGTTLIASGYTAGSAVVVNKDGLAAALIT